MDDRLDASLALSALVLDRLSPQEIPLVDVLGPALYANRDSKAARDGALGFGVPEVTWLMATVPVMSVVVNVLADTAKSVAVEHLSRPLSDWLGKLTERRRRGPAASEPPPAPPPLPPELLTRIHQESYRQALALGLEDARARLMADAVAGTLTVRTA